ncbi:TRAP transporter small permease subunit [Desulfocicer niacini]
MQSRNSGQTPDDCVEKSKISNNLLSLFETMEKTLCTIGSIALGMMAVVLGVGIVSRYVFGYPIPGVYDIVQLLLVWVVFLSLSFTQKEDRHIRVEIILRYLSPRNRLYFDLAAMIFGFLLCTMMSLQAAKLAWSSIIIQEYWPGLLRVPIYPSKIALFLGISAFAIRLFLEVINMVQRLRSE